MIYRKEEGKGQEILWDGPMRSKCGMLKGKGNHTERMREREKARETYRKSTLSKRKGKREKERKRKGTGRAVGRTA